MYAATQTDGQVAIVVVDDGPGIPPDQVGRVFDRLYTVRDTPGRAVGTGLGLAIVRELAAAMGGTARAEAAPGGGTRFVVSLPVARARRVRLTRFDDGRDAARIDARTGLDLAPQHRQRDRAGAARHLADLAAVEHAPPRPAPTTPAVGAQAAQVPVHVAARVDAAHQLLADEAALRERHRDRRSSPASCGMVRSSVSKPWRGTPASIRAALVRVGVDDAARRPRRSAPRSRLPVPTASNASAPRPVDRDELHVGRGAGGSHAAQRERGDRRPRARRPSPGS